MTTLAEFLLARIADTETDARALDKELQRWHRERDANGPDGSQGSILASLITPESALHPARVLAECEAKRRIMANCRVDYEDHLTSGDDTGDLATETMQMLALPYADHPDFDESWRP